jgi:hypothetical protein
MIVQPEFFFKSGDKTLTRRRTAILRAACHECTLYANRTIGERT